MELDLTAILNVLVSGGIVWLIRASRNAATWQSRVDTLLTGASGDNGIVGDVRSLRRRAHEMGDDIHGLKGRSEIHEIRISTLEGDRRHGPSDRRAMQ
jgi:hypothetical protein